VPGTLVMGKRSFGLLRFTGPEEARTLDLEARGSKGELLRQHKIRARDLR